MRVLLTHPPLLPGQEVSPPLGLCTLAAWLCSRGHETRILDLDLETKSPSAEGFIETFSRTFADFQPTAVGVTSMYSNSLQAEQLIRAAKRLDESVATIAGGSHFGALANRALIRIPELDYAIEGEAEESFAALLDSLERGVDPAPTPRLHYRRDGQLLATPAAPLMDLAGLPPIWPSLDGVIDLSRYPRTIPKGAGRRIMFVEAGRGCPFRCTFCATAPFWEQRYRVKPARRIVEEMRFLNQELGYDSFILVHDLLTANLKFISLFCDEMLEAQLPVEWMANSRTDIRLHGLLPKMKAAGCWKLFHGIESASSRLQVTIDKHLPVDSAASSIQDLLDHGIGATCSFVIGLPGETPEDLSATVALGATLKLAGVETVQLHRLRLFPPAPLTRRGLPGQFDPDSLRIEYPFVEVPADDLDAIERDPEFFSGYWTPDSPAGTAEQLAQVEMAFHHLLALAPLTMAAMSRFAGGTLVSSFYAALGAGHLVDRSSLDWESGNLWGNWMAFDPLLTGWIADHLTLDVWQRRLLLSLKDYEFHRICFTHGPQGSGQFLVSGENWAAADVGLNMEWVLDLLSKGEGLMPAVLQDSIVVFSRTPESFAAFAVDRSLREQLIHRAEHVVGQFAPSDR